MKKHILVILGALLSVSLSAAKTYDFTSSIPEGWSCSATPQGYESTGEARGSQFTSSATLTLKGVKDVSSVKIVASSNLDAAYSITVNVSSQQLGEKVVLPKENNATYTFSTSTGVAADGDLIISIKKEGTKKSIWIKSVTVEGEVPADIDPATRLDPTYEYPDSVIILPKDSLGKLKLDTIIDNILLQCASAALYKTDIRVMANNTLTITAAQPIVGIRVDGGVRKAFSAASSEGQLSYASDPEADIEEAEPVLLIKDINATTLSLACGAQLRMQRLIIYFKDNPNAEIEGGTQGGEEEEEGGEMCPVTSTGTWNFVNAYTQTEYFNNYGTIDFTFFTNDTYYYDEEENLYGVGDGVVLSVSIYPMDIEDLSDTYTMEDETLDDYYTYLLVYEGSDEGVESGLGNGVFTLKLEDDGTYSCQYSFTDSISGAKYEGTISGICYSGIQGGGDITYESITVEQAITIGEAMEDGATDPMLYYIEGYATSAGAAVGDTIQTIYLADTIIDGVAAKELLALQCWLLSDPVQIGDKVAVMGYLTKVKNVFDGSITIQVKEGTLWVIEHPLPEEEEQAIEQVVTPLDRQALMFNAVGQRVDATYRGIIIQNGNKYLLR